VDLAYNKTVSIIFPAAVRSVDLGSRSIMADKAADVENVLKVKASQIGFNETNFAVMTADGKFYSFVVNYNETPAVLALNLSGSAPVPGQSLPEQVSLENRTEFMNGANEQGGSIQFAGVKATQSDIVYACDQILRKRQRGKSGAKSYKMEARLRGLFVKDNVLYYRVVIGNDSNLNYDIDYIRYFVVDSKTTKLTSRQEIELRPIYVYNEAITTVRGHTTLEKVYAFQRFTIPNNKQLLVVMGEQGGGRQLTFSVQGQDIMRARVL
jgi:conjugative transposon TraN protein